MKIRDFVDAFRRKPANQESSVPPKNKGEDEPLPLVEVADVVSKAERPPVPILSAPVVQTLMGSVPIPQRFDPRRGRDSALSSAGMVSQPVPLEPSGVPPAVPDPEPDASNILEIGLEPGPAVSLEQMDTEPTLGQSASWAEADPLGDLVPTGPLPATPLVPPPPPPSPLAASLADPLADFHTPPTPTPSPSTQHMANPFASPPPSPPPAPSSPPPRMVPPAPPLADPWFSSPSPPPPLSPPSRPTPVGEMTGLDALLSSSSEGIPTFKPVSSLPPAARPTPVRQPALDTRLIEVFQKLAIFTGDLAETTSSEGVYETLVRAVQDCLQAARAFLIPFDIDGNPLPVPTEVYDTPPKVSLEGMFLTRSFAGALMERVGTPEKSSIVVQLASGQTLLPPNQAATVEWYLLPQVTLPGALVIGVQWNAPVGPPAYGLAVAEVLLNCAQSVLLRLDTPPLPPEPEPAMIEPVEEESVVQTVLPQGVAENVLKLLDEAIFVIDNQRHLRFGNPMAEFLTGCFQGELQSSTFDEVSQGPGLQNATLWQHLHLSLEDQQIHTDVNTLDGGSLSVTVSALTLPATESPAHDEFAQGRVIAIRDVTQSRLDAAQAVMAELETTRHELDQTRMQLEQSRAELFAAMNVGRSAPPPDQVNAFRNSLMMVLGFSELLNRGEYGQMNPQQFEMFRNIEHHAKQMSALLETLLPSS
ncbi:MAG TPA: hypothetical protein PLB32_04980 [Acidobacteriota bacterium]|nr:hypothetical protein [Acidobacteriota bacterium]